MDNPRPLPPRPSSDRVFDLAETGKNDFLIFGADTDAVVFYVDSQTIVFGGKADPYMPFIIRTKLYGVRYKIYDGLN